MKQFLGPRLLIASYKPFKRSHFINSPWFIKNMSALDQIESDNKIIFITFTKTSKKGDWKYTKFWSYHKYPRFMKVFIVLGSQILQFKYHLFE